MKRDHPEQDLPAGRSEKLWNYLLEAQGTDISDPVHVHVS